MWKQIDKKDFIKYFEQYLNNEFLPTYIKIVDLERGEVYSLLDDLDFTTLQDMYTDNDCVIFIKSKTVND